MVRERYDAIMSLRFRSRVASCAVPDILEKRAPHRAAHLAAAQKCVDAGTLLMAGAFTEAPLGAAFIFTPKATKALVAEFVKTDPYVLNGLVTAHRVHEWATPVLSHAVDASTNI
jgi:uncharacterized protein